MRLLIDSHTLVWWFESLPALSLPARNAIADPSNEVLVSAVALWELMIKVSTGKLSLPADIETMVIGEGFAVLPISFVHLRGIPALPRVHRDPFDRMMIAQALAEGIPIATSDRVFASYGAQIIW